MDNAINCMMLKNKRKCVCIGYIKAVEFKMGIGDKSLDIAFFDCGIIVRVKIIYANNRVSFCEEFLSEMTADKSCASGNENSLHDAGNEGEFLKLCNADAAPFIF